MGDAGNSPLKAGAEIEAEWLPGRPWVKGVIEGVDVFSGTYNVRYEDGYRQYSKPRHSIRLLGPPIPPMPSWSLVCVDSPSGGGETLIPIGNELMQMGIGRQCQAPALWEQLIPDERLRNSVSREHCQILCTPPGPGMPATFVVVNKSSAGTSINGAPVQQEAQLQDGDVVGVGNSASPGSLPQTVLHFRFVVQIGAPQPPTHSAAGGGAVSARFCLECVHVLDRPPADVASVPECERVLLAEPSPPGRGILRVGRERQPPEVWAQLIHEDIHRNKISREHFEITLAGVEARLVNISGAGTLVNGSCIRESVGLKPGDVVAFPMSPDDTTPIASFRFCLGDSPGVFGGGAAAVQSPALAPTARAAAAPSAGPPDAAAGPQVLRLACVAVQGLAPNEVLQLSDAARCLELSGPLRVGRTSTPGFLEALVRDERVRNMISREHFEVRLDEAGRPIVANLSGAGTIVDGTRTKETALLRPGSLVAVPSQAGDSDPAVVFQLETLCGGQLVGSQAAAPESIGSQVIHDRRPTTYPAVPQAGPAPSDGNMPFVLECVSALGLSTADLSFRPNFSRFLGPTSHIRVGRMVQPQEVWEALVPNEGLRNTISREQFEISAAEPGAYVLKNKASTGTLVNERPVPQLTQLSANDVIGVGLAPHDATQPILRFRFLLGDAARAGTTAATVPANVAIPRNLPQH